ncbi:MAG: SIS domain-containing protein [Planctomycetota bacterium]|jgi:6-phospho-3-hexuloisomerase|nr:SIS domain-containing protein [Planctomycetota bacterium]
MTEKKQPDGRHPTTADGLTAARLRQNLRCGISRLGEVFAKADLSGAVRLVDLLTHAPTVFLAGAGRSGLVARCLAMRLMQLGKNVHVAGDTVAPAITREDMLLILTGSGETAGLAVLAEKAAQNGAFVAAVTAHPAAGIPGRANLTVKIPIEDDAKAVEPPPGVHPLGSLFEQAAFLFLEAVVVELMDRLGQTQADMRRRHANLE